jgi:hypothetical protein
MQNIVLRNPRSAAAPTIGAFSLSIARHNATIALFNAAMIYQRIKIKLPADGKALDNASLR